MERNTINWLSVNISNFIISEDEKLEKSKHMEN